MMRAVVASRLRKHLNRDYERDRGPSLAAQRRAREKARLAAQPFLRSLLKKRIREVISAGNHHCSVNCANRMAEPGKEVDKGA